MLSVRTDDGRVIPVKSDRVDWDRSTLVFYGEVDVTSPTTFIGTQFEACGIFKQCAFPTGDQPIVPGQTLKVSYRLNADKDIPEPLRQALINSFLPRKS